VGHGLGKEGVQNTSPFRVNRKSGGSYTHQHEEGWEPEEIEMWKISRKIIMTVVAAVTYQYLPYARMVSSANIC
jgi:hypothetical protein